MDRDPEVSFDASPEPTGTGGSDLDGEVATLVLDVDEHAGLVPGYELKMNSYDLGVDIELYDAVQRLRFEHPEVRAVVVTGGKQRMFCAGANIRMLAQSSHPWKVNFCKFTNETRLGIEDATANSGQTYLAALNGNARGRRLRDRAGLCDRIMLVDDNSSAVSLPEVPLLGVLPGTGGLTRRRRQAAGAEGPGRRLRDQARGRAGQKAARLADWWTRRCRGPSSTTWYGRGRSRRAARSTRPHR